MLQAAEEKRIGESHKIQRHANRNRTTAVKESKDNLNDNRSLGCNAPQNGAPLEHHHQMVMIDKIIISKRQLYLKELTSHNDTFNTIKGQHLPIPGPGEGVNRWIKKAKSSLNISATNHNNTSTKVAQSQAAYTFNKWLLIFLVRFSVEEKMGQQGPVWVWKTGKDSEVEL